MKKTLLISTLLIAQFTPTTAGVIDTLRHYDPATAANSTAYINATWYPEQYAAFEPPAPGFIKSVIVTLGGTTNSGSVTLHLYGHEGGSNVPQIQKDLITPMIVKKTVAGIQRIQIDLPTPVWIDNNQFFIKISNFSSGVTLISDKTTHASFCSSTSGGSYYMQYAKNANGGFIPFKNAFVVDVIMDYTEGLTSPRYFKDITAAAGIDTNLSTWGHSVSWADINKDGLLDLLVAGKLYKNNGNLTFTDITAAAGINIVSDVSTFIDMNNDGKDDILFLNEGGVNLIYINNGNETFTKQTLKLSTPDFVSLSTLSICDFNNDGYPDLFVGQLWKNDSAGNEKYYRHNLYVNDKNLGFIDTTSLIIPDSLDWQTLSGTSGASPYVVGTGRAVYAAQWVDYNDDGKMDLYVANYRLQPDELWKNNGNGTFTNVCETLGIDVNNQGGNGHGTGCDWADYDNDGNMDLLLTQLAHPRYLMYDHRPTTIYKNNGAPAYDFTDMNPGVNKGNIGIEYEETNTGANWGDLNNDGLLDFGITAIYGCRYADVYLQKSDHAFEMKSFAFGVKDINADMDLVFVDFDNDGKLDMAVGVNTGSGPEFRLFKNDGSFKGNYVELDLISTSGNKEAVGAKTIVYAEGKAHTQYQMPYHGVKMSKGNRIHVGLDNAQKVDSVVVRWSNGTLKTEKFTGLAINNLNILTEGGSVKVDTFQTKIWDVTGIKKENGFLSKLIVYPNPASTEVMFSYELATNARVTLDIYSILGQKISILNEQQQPSGKHTLQWQTKDAHGNKLATGVYSYRMQINEEIKTGLVVIE